MANDLFNKLESQYGLPAGLLDSVWSAESGRGKNMRSPAGAMGHFQFMPATAKEYGLTDPSDLTQSATAAARKFSDLKKAYKGDTPKMLAAYNWGNGNLDRNGLDKAPAETRNYIKKVSANMGTATVGRDLSADLFGESPAKAAQAAGRDLSAELFTPDDKEPGMLSSIGQGVGNFAAGAVRGAGSIGATLLAPRDALEGFIARKMGAPELAPQDRRAAMDEGLQTMGAEPDSLAYKGGKLAGEITGTAGAGGVVANTLSSVPKVAAAAPNLINAIRSGGLSAPGANLLTRSAGGAISGAATAGLANPEDAPGGAFFGGLLPGGINAAGVTGGLLRRGTGSLVKNTTGLMSGVGGEAVETAYKAGRSGGTNFLDNMRGNVPLTDVLDDAKSALAKMRLDRGAQYRQGMAGVSADKTVVDFTPIDKAVTALKSMGNYKGQAINKNAAGAVDEISDLVTQWKSLDPKEFHTPEGLDALKQAISDIRDTTQFGTAARKAADTAYNAVKGEITTQAPTYAKVMKDYSQASETLQEVERALSLGNRAAADTSMRKLQSLMRNNVNTNYGNRLGLAKTLESNGAEILPAVAGQAMSSWTPRGLAGATTTPLAALAAYANPLALAALPGSSPRLLGEMAYGLGAANRGVASGGNALMQTMLRGSPSKPITMNQLAPFLAATPILAANQK